MDITTCKCDICGKIGTSSTYGGPDGWASLSIATEDKEEFFKHSKDICPDCIVANGLDDAMLSLKKSALG